MLLAVAIVGLVLLVVLAALVGVESRRSDQISTGTGPDDEQLN